MTKLYPSPKIPPHKPGCCSDIVLGWYSAQSFDFMRWFPSTKRWRLVPSGDALPSSRKVIAWSKLEYPSKRELSKLAKARGSNGSKVEASL